MRASPVAKSDFPARITGGALLLSQPALCRLSVWAICTLSCVTLVCDGHKPRPVAWHRTVPYAPAPIVIFFLAFARSCSPRRCALLVLTAASEALRQLLPILSSVHPLTGPSLHQPAARLLRRGHHLLAGSPAPLPHGPPLAAPWTRSRNKYQGWTGAPSAAARGRCRRPSRRRSRTRL